MKTTIKYHSLAFAAIGSIASFVAFFALPAQSALGQGNGKGKGNSSQQHGKGSPNGAKQVGEQFSGQQSSGQQLGGSQNSSVGGILSPTQAAQLTRMLEEEKLAHDVYLALAKTSGLQIFTTIAKAESQHMRAVEQLASRYSLALSAKNLTAGTFSNPQLQALYQNFVTSGSKSPLEAAMVGVRIEEMDIKDLQKLLSENPPQEIAQVLKHLQSASTNHLRAFAATVKELGGTNNSELLNQQEFNKPSMGSQMKQGLGKSNVKRGPGRHEDK